MGSKRSAAADGTQANRGRRGTRPEAVKMAPVYLRLAADPRTCVKLLVAAQHREMLDQVLRVFTIKPDIDLGVMRPNQALAEISGLVITAVEDVLARSIQRRTGYRRYHNLSLLRDRRFLSEDPRWPCRGGLRNCDLLAPWLEEMNRRLTDPLCRWCFAPTKQAAANLRSEAISSEHIFIAEPVIL